MDIGGISYKICPNQGGTVGGTISARCLSTGLFDTPVNACYDVLPLDSGGVLLDLTAVFVTTYQGMQLGMNTPFIKVRRSADNVESGVIFDPNTKGPTVGSIPLSTWLSGSTAYVVAWYALQHRYGSEAAARQTDRNLQPTFDVKTNQVDFKPNKFLVMDDGLMPAGSSSYLVIVKHGRIINTDGCVLGTGLVDYARRANNFGRSGATYVNSWPSGDSGIKGGTYADGSTVGFAYDGTQRRIYQAGELKKSEAPGITRDGASTYNYIGKSSVPGSELNGELSFIGIFGNYDPNQNTRGQAWDSTLVPIFKRV